MLLDPLVQPNDIDEDEHRSILLALLTQGYHKLALKYSNIRKPPQKTSTDLQLQIAILLANGMVHEAFQFQRDKRSSTYIEDLLTYFLSKAEKLGKLDTILQLTLTTSEDKCLVDFLHQSTYDSSQEILLEYFLQRARYSDAIKLNELLSKGHKNSRAAQTRKAIIDRYAKLIPSMTMTKNFLPLPEPTWSRPSYLNDPAHIEIAYSDKQPVFQAMSHEERFESATKALMPLQQSAPTPFRSRTQRIDQIGLFRASQDLAQPRKFPEMPVSTRCRTPEKSTSPNNTDVSKLFAVLSTPIVGPRTPLNVRRPSSSKVLLVAADEGRCHTPQSILKVKRLLQSEDIGSPFLPRPLSPSHNVDPDAAGWLTKPLDTRSRESTPGKSLRFNVPKRLPPPDLEVLDESLELKLSPEKSPPNNEDSDSDIEIVDDPMEGQDWHKLESDSLLVGTVYTL
jgi:hypothetical protein